MKTLVHYAVWGKVYINRFVNYALPTQITPGNLGALSKGSVIRITTRQSDVNLVAKSKAVIFARTLIDVDIVGIPDSFFERPTGDKYSIILELQNDILKNSRDFEAIIFGYGDALWSEGTYKSAISRLASGYDLVLCVGFNVVEKDFIKLLEKKFGTRPINKRAIAPRAFAEMVVNNLHIMSASRLWDRPHMNNYPSFLLWSVKDKGILARAFHLHPVAIRVKHSDASFFRPFNVTIDEDLVPRLIQEGAVPYISDCSDEMFVCGLAGEVTESHLWHYPLRPPNVSDVVVFAERSASLHQHMFFDERLRIIYAGDVQDEDWQSAERKSDRVCSAVTRRLFLPDDVLRWETPRAYEARKDRRARVSMPRAPKLSLTLADIKSADTQLLKVIAIHYLDRKGASFFGVLGIGGYWPIFRRRARRTFQMMLRKKPDELVLDGQAASLAVNFTLPDANLWQVVLVSMELMQRSRGTGQ